MIKKAVHVSMKLCVLFSCFLLIISLFPARGSAWFVPESTGKVRVLGINNTEDSKNSFEDFFRIFQKSYYPGYAKESTSFKKFVYNGDTSRATITSIDNLLDNVFGESNDEDLNILYYSGHGYVYNISEDDVIRYNYNTVGLVVGGAALHGGISEAEYLQYVYSFERLAHRLDQYNGHFIVILDCCFAATFQRYITDQSKYTCILSAESNMSALGVPCMHRQFYTDRMIEGASINEMYCFSADSNMDGTITVNEMYNYATTLLNSLTQKPVFSGDGGYPLFSLNSIKKIPGSPVQLKEGQTKNAGVYLAAPCPDYNKQLRFESSNSSVASVDEKTQKITAAGTGKATITAYLVGPKNAVCYGTEKTFDVEVYLSVDSAKAEKPAYQGSPVKYTVETSSGAKYLHMYDENGDELQKWSSKGSSVVSGEKRIWTVFYTFSDIGKRTMTFDASADGNPTGMYIKTASVTVQELATDSVSLNDTEIYQKEQVDIKAVTTKNAKYLVIYLNGKRLISWPAKGYSKTSGKTRVWNVTYTFEKTGEHTITVYPSIDDEMTGLGKSTSIKVRIPPTKVTLSPSGTAKLSVDDTVQLTATLSPKKAESRLKWTSSDKKVAKVDKNGVVTGVSEGTATITVTTENGKTASVKITVKKTEFAGGKGTKASPYLVANLTHLKNVGNHNGKYFKQIKDIDGKNAKFKAIYTGTGFTGYYDGNGYTIMNLKVEDGIFGRVGQGGSIKSVTLSGIQVTATHFNGALVGTNEGTLSKCHVSKVKITGNGWDVETRYYGGLCGWNKGGTISGCTAKSVTIMTKKTGTVAGGIVGLASFGGTIKNCKTTSSKLYQVTSGGIIGSCNETTVSGCSANKVTLSGGDAGGIAGTAWNGTMKNCKVTNSTIRGVEIGYNSIRGVGGVVGFTNKNQVLTGCTSTGNTITSPRTDRMGKKYGYQYEY